MSIIQLTKLISIAFLWLQVWAAGFCEELGHSPAIGNDFRSQSTGVADNFGKNLYF